MSVFTLFSNIYAAAMCETVDDPNYAQVTAQIRAPNKHNILFYRLEEIQLDAAESKSIALASMGYTNTEWLFLVARVIGGVALDTAGLNTVGGAITGRISGIGTRDMPGVIVLSGARVTDTLTAVGLEDGSVMELFAAISCEDDDTRLETNA